MMKLSEAKEGHSYYVKIGTKCETLQPGDKIRIERGDLLCIQAAGRLPKGQWEELDAVVEDIGGFSEGGGI